MKNTVIPFLFVAHFWWILALQGNVLNDLGNPVPMAEISWQNSSTESDSAGSFFYPPNITKLKISHPQYHSQTLLLSLPKPNAPEVPMAEVSLLEVILLKKPAKAPRASQEVVAIGDASSVAAALNKRFYLKGHNLPGESAELSLSGQKSKNSLVLLENIPLNMSGQPVDIGTFGSLVSDFAEVDIYQPTSSLAVGGELNLIQCLSGQSQVKLAQAVGSYGLQSSLVQIDGFTQNHNYRFGYSHLRADNDYQYTDYWGNRHTRDDNQKQIDNLSLALDGHSFKFRQVNIFFDKGLPGATNELDYFTGASSQGHQSVSTLSHHYQLAHLAIDSDLGYNLLHSRYDNSSPALSGRELDAEHHFSAFYSKVKPSCKHKEWSFWLPLSYKGETFSYDESKNDGSAEADISSKSKNLYTAGLGCTRLWELPWVKVLPELGLLAGSEEKIMPRASVLLQGKLLSAGASYRQSVCPASFYDKFWQAGSLAMGNPDLKSEQATSYSSFLAWQSKHFSSKLFYSYTKNQNLISWQRTFQGWKPFNIGKSSTEYYELSGKVLLSNAFWASGKISRTIATDRSDYNGKYIPYTPVGMIKAGFGYKLKPLTLEVDYSAIGRQYTTVDQVNSSAYLGSYDFWDVSLAGDFAYKMLALRPSLRLCNVFDQEYNTYAFDPQPGFHWQSDLQIVYSFKN